jgi:hypothetical protein
MKYRTFVAALATAVLAGLAANCGGHTNQSIAGGGVAGGITTPSPIVVGLTVAGPPTIAPGQTAQFTATAALSNRTTADYTAKVTWTASPPSVLTITHDTGAATGQSVGDATITAILQTGSCCQARASVTVLPPNAFRLTGRVLESGLPVQGATITVQSGVGAGLLATTDNGGGYRLYGVAGGIQVKFSKPGYVDIVKAFTAVQNDVLDFPEATQTVAIPSLAGLYTLTLTADPTCPTDPVRGVPPLPTDLRQPRTYTASLTQNGPSLTVTLTDPVIVQTQNQFSGRVDPDSIEFSVGSNDLYYGSYYGAIFERLSTTQELEVHGQVRAHRNGSVISGSLNGGFELITLPGYGMVANCVAPNNQLALTPAAQPSRHR